MQETNNNGRVGRLIYSDVRHKLDIQLVDVLPTGIKLYRYRYRWSATEYVGVLAQEVAAFLPEAVCPDADGSLRWITRALGCSCEPIETGCGWDMLLWNPRTDSSWFRGAAADYF